MSKPNFILLDNPRDGVPNFLLEKVHGFSQSHEYSLLDEELRKLPGLVCAAFVRYLVRICQQNGARSRAVESGLEAIEELCGMGDVAIDDLVETELFENLNGPAHIVAELEGRLGPKSRAVHDDLIARHWI